MTISHRRPPFAQCLGSQFTPVQPISSRARRRRGNVFFPLPGRFLLFWNVSIFLRGKRLSGAPTAWDENLALLAKNPVFMRVCEQCQVAQFNGKWHCSEKGYFLTENKLYQFKATKYAKSCRTVPSGTVQKPRFYAGLSPTVPFPSLKPPSAWALKSRFGAAGFSEGGWQAARAWVRGRSGRLFPLPCLRSRPHLRYRNDSER